MFVLYHTILFYFIVNVKLCVTALKKCFIFFINIISVQVNQSALLNVSKIMIWRFESYVTPHDKASLLL